MAFKAIGQMQRGGAKPVDNPLDQRRVVVADGRPRVPVGKGPTPAQVAIVPARNAAEEKRRRMEEDLEADRRKMQQASIMFKSQQSGFPTVALVGVRFSIFGKEELLASGVRISLASLDAPGGLSDPRLGVVEGSTYCASCFQNNEKCPGHMGYIELEEPVYHPLLFPVIVKVMNCICMDCGCLRMSHNQIKEKGYHRLTEMARLDAISAESEKLGRCSQSRKVKDGKVLACRDPYRFMSPKQGDAPVLKTTTGHIVSIQTVLRVLSVMDPEDIVMLGFSVNSHPKNMIIELFPFIPVRNRPNTQVEGLNQVHPLTELYQAIINANNSLAEIKRKMPAGLVEDARGRLLSESDFSKAYSALRLAISNFMSNPESSSQQNINYKAGIQQMIQGKKAHVRDAMMGKRVNFSGRTVISPDPTLKFGQVRIPRQMAKILTVPITVCQYNNAQITALLRAGRVNTIKPANAKMPGMIIRVRPELAATYEFTDGDIAERWLQDGDYVMVNRQPTLHKQSMMGYEAVIRDVDTIGLHISATTPHNADFDGDEMNVHVIPSLSGRAELEELVNIKECIMSAQTNRPAIGVVYDSVTSAYILTNDKTMLTPDEYARVITVLVNGMGMVGLNERLARKKIHKLSGKGVFSTLLPPDFNYQNGKLVIEDGILVSGRITKNHIGPASGSIVQVLHKEYGFEKTSNFITDANYLLNEYLAIEGFTVGLRDCVPTDKLLQAKREEEVVMRERIRQLGPPPTDRLDLERYELQLGNITNAAKTKPTEVVPQTNNLVITTLAGTKGGDANLRQIMMAGGQQNFQGKIIQKSMLNGTRTSPYFTPEEDNPESRGYVSRSFLEGFTASEIFFHQYAGREGLMDTALKTSDTGSMQHKIVKALEDMKIGQFGEVRNANGVIFQLVYGGDGFDAAEMVNVKGGGQSAEDTFPNFIDFQAEERKLKSRYDFS